MDKDVADKEVDQDQMGKSISASSASTLNIG
jgi:hypothetical protein